MNQELIRYTIEQYDANGKIQTLWVEGNPIGDHFSVRRMGDSFEASYAVDHVKTGALLALFDVFENAVAFIEAITELPIPWGEMGRDQDKNLGIAGEHYSTFRKIRDRFYAMEENFDGC
jgi:hypothetical protein